MALRAEEALPAETPVPNDALKLAQKAVTESKELEEILTDDDEPLHELVDSSGDEEDPLKSAEEPTDEDDADEDVGEMPLNEVLDVIKAKHLENSLRNPNAARPKLTRNQRRRRVTDARAPERASHGVEGVEGSDDVNFEQNRAYNIF